MRNCSASATRRRAVGSDDEAAAEGEEGAGEKEARMRVWRGERLEWGEEDGEEERRGGSSRRKER